MRDDLSSLGAAEIDALPFGYIALAADGTVRRYNRYEADLARRDPRDVLGRNFFREVAPCTSVREFEGRFLDLVAGTGDDNVRFDFEFRFGHGLQKVRIGMVRSPSSSEVILTVNRVRDLSLPTTAVLEPDVLRGLLTDTFQHPVVVADRDFWRALEDGLAGRPAEDREVLLHAVGLSWGKRHAERVDALVQGLHGLALREAELQLALEALTGSLGILGLGRCDFDLDLRDQGLVVVRHRHDPIASSLSERGDYTATLLAGFFAGVVSHLAGRALCGWPARSARRPEEESILLIGTAARLARLRSPGAPDRSILATLGAGETVHA